MFHLSENNLITNKPVKYALRNIFGINKWNSLYVCQYVGINPSVRINALHKTQIYKLNNIINKKIEVNHDLKNKLKFFLKCLYDIRTYRGLRNKSGLPVRGQRTKTNAKTKKKLKFKI